MAASGICAAENIPVSNEADLLDAVDTINGSDNGDFTISLQKDITVTKQLDFSSGAKKTILGNGHTIYFNYPGVESLITLINGELDLGTDGQENSLTLDGSNSTGGTSSSVIFVNSNQNGNGCSPVLNMYDGVTIQNYKTDNSLGAGVRLNTDTMTKQTTSTFNMYGGTIKNCGIVSGSETFGGGVFVGANGIFNMKGGTIEENTAQYGGGVCLMLTQNQPGNVNDPKFFMDGGEIKDNSASKDSGGVYVYDGNFTMEGGVIEGNSASNNAGGVYVLYGNFTMKKEGVIKDNSAARGGGVYVYGNRTNGSFTMEGGEISDNAAQAHGGGVYVNSNGKISITGGEITGNSAGNYGGGIYTQQSDLTISNASITDNSATMGGGILMLFNKFNLQAGSILCNNEASDAGADYYGASVSVANLTSASDMNQEFHNSGYMIDGWYWDEEDLGEGYHRWIDQPQYKGDTVNYQQDAYDEIVLIAAYTKYNEIEITKNWADGSDSAGLRPAVITITLIDPATGQPVKIRTMDGTEGEDATIILSSENQQDDNPDVWTGTIGPLDLRDYSNYILDEGSVANYSVSKSAITKASEKTYKAIITNSYKKGSGGSGGSGGSNSSGGSGGVLPRTGFAPGVVTKLPPQSVGYDYSHLYLQLPALGVRSEILGVPFDNGDWDVTWLGDNVGWLQNTAYPGSLDAGNTVITGHSINYLGRPGVFANLQMLSYGSPIVITAFGETYTYTVQDVETVYADTTQVLSQNTDLPTLTLITCKFYNPSTNEYEGRVVVQAVLTDVR